MEPAACPLFHVSDQSPARLQHRGARTNGAEAYFSRLRRAELGHHHHIAGPYLLRHAQEAAWREDLRRVSNGEQTHGVVGLAMGCPPSVDFCGCWQRAHTVCHTRQLTTRHEAAAARVAGLIPRQRKIMAMVLASYSSKNIMVDFGIGYRTRESHRASIMRRRGLASLPALSRRGLARRSAADST